MPGGRRLWKFCSSWRLIALGQGESLASALRTTCRCRACTADSDSPFLRSWGRRSRPGGISDRSTSRSSQGRNVYPCSSSILSIGRNHSSILRISFAYTPVACVGRKDNKSANYEYDHMEHVPPASDVLARHYRELWFRLHVYLLLRYAQHALATCRSACGGGHFACDMVRSRTFSIYTLLTQAQVFPTLVRRSAKSWL